jgi:6-phosphogluconolactonase (cycloisomerase 2 family)
MNAGNKIVIKNADSNEQLTLSGNGPFSFKSPANHSSTSVIDIVQRPTNQLCSVVSSSSQLQPSALSFTINCTTQTAAYVVNQGDNTISMYTINSDGSLSAMSPSVVSTDIGPNALVIDPLGKYLYTDSFGVNGEGNTLRQYRILGDGSLSLIDRRVLTNSGASSMSLDSQGKFLYVTHSGDSLSLGNTITQYKIDSNGSLSPLAIPFVYSGMGPTSIALDPSGQYAYVTNFGNYFGNTLSLFNIVNGSLQPMTPSVQQVAPGLINMVVSPSGRYAYALNCYSSSAISQFSINSTGALIPIGAVPIGSGTSTCPSSMKIDPTEKYAYVSDFFNHSLLQFAITNGGLTAMTPSTVPTGNSPVNVVVHPSGQYVYVINNADNTLSQFLVSASGTLSPMATASVGTGQSPMAIAILPQ